MCPWEGAKERRGSRILGSPLRSAGTERGVQRLRGEHNPHLRQAEETPAQTGVLLPCAPRPQTRVRRYGQGLKLSVECAVHRKSTAVGLWTRPGKLEVGGASRDSTGFGALEEGLVSS